MKFQYAYRDRNNERREGVIDAPSKDEAFCLLRQEGVRPFFVALAPGVLNRLRSFGKRGLAIAVLCALCLVLGALAFFISYDARNAKHEAQSTLLNAQSTLHFLDSPARRQPIGDLAVIEKGIRTGWADVFELEGDRFLASFAIPGYEPALRTTSVEAVERCLEVGRSPRDRRTSLESRQIIAMVGGMKDELRRFLASGGTISAYGRRLVQRQQEEISYYNRVKNELETAEKFGLPRAELEALLEERNAALRAMGIRLVSMNE